MLGKFSDFLARIDVFKLGLAVLILLLGGIVAKRARVAFENLNTFDPQQRHVLSKIAYYGLVTGTIMLALSQLGIELKVLLGAAGILTVAVGFAAQTSASNLISGIFLVLEKPFMIGDVISIGETRGVVMSIDLLSSKIRTFSNVMVRIPNETLMKSSVINYTYFPLRRLDFNITVHHESDLGAVEQALRSAAQTHPLCLDDPQPVFLINGFVDAGVSVQFQVWTMTENIVTLQNELYREIKRIFGQIGVRIAFANRESPAILPGPSPAVGTRP